MPIQKIIANNSAEGLRRISEEHGDDALILKTIKRNGRVEFFVEVDELVAEMDAATIAETQPSAPMPQEAFGGSERDPETNKQIQAQYREARLKMLSAIAEQADNDEFAEPYDPEPTRKPIRKIQSELTVNSLLDSLQLTPGIAARLRGCKRIDEVTANLAFMLESESALTDGIFAFVGPAGSGKTTSLMKVIVNHVMNYGENSCAIINCDRYSVGAMDRIQRFGELVGVDVIQVGPERDLNHAIASVAKRRLVVIDTPGLSPKSTDLHQQLQSIVRSHYEIQRLLVLPANLQYDSMQMARKLYGGKRLTTCIATRMDETMSCGALLSFLAQSELPIRYLGTGPQIPEDIVAADIPELIHTSISLMDEEFAKAGLSDLTKEELNKKFGSRSSAASDILQQDKVMDL